MSKLRTTERNIWNHFFFNGGNCLFSFDYATFAGGVVNPGKRQVPSMSVHIKAPSLLNFYREHCLLVRCFISAAIILLHLHLSLSCAVARPPRAVYHATVTSWLEAGGNFWFNSASGGLGVYTHKHQAPAVRSREDAAEGRKMFAPSIASTLTDAHIELL